MLIQEKHKPDAGQGVEIGIVSQQYNKKAKDYISEEELGMIMTKKQNRWKAR